MPATATSCACMHESTNVNKCMQINSLMLSTKQSKANDLLAVVKGQYSFDDMAKSSRRPGRGGDRSIEGPGLYVMALPPYKYIHAQAIIMQRRSIDRSHGSKRPSLVARDDLPVLYCTCWFLSLPWQCLYCSGKSSLLPECLLLFSLASMHGHQTPKLLLLVAMI
jgi:hypothetical protein